jgi:hypothetical protein
MSQTLLTDSASDGIKRQAAAAGAAAAASHQCCEECLGSGGWFRYEPALEPSPGLLYLSCLQCRGSGRTAAARA